MTIKTVPVLLAALILCGCGHTPLREIHPAALPSHPAEDSITQARAENLRKLLAPLQIRGTVIFPAAVFGRFETSAVLDALQHCNFNRIYCHITSEQELDENLQKFICAAGERGFEVEIIISQIDFYRKYQVNQMIRRAMIQYPTLVEVAAMVAEFNLQLPEKFRLKGVTVHLAPHLYNGINVRRMYGSIYCWAENRYGIGEDNDMLVRQSFDLLKQIAALENMPPLTAAVPDFLHERAKKGDLSCGTVSDFAAIVSQIAVVNSANLPSELTGNIAAELADVPQKNKLLAVIPLATHTSVDSGRLRRRNWDDMLRSTEHLIKSSRKFPAFNGIILSPFSVVEYLRLEK